MYLCLFVIDNLRNYWRNLNKLSIENDESWELKSSLNFIHIYSYELGTQVGEFARRSQSLIYDKETRTKVEEQYLWNQKMVKVKSD